MKALKVGIIGFGTVGTGVYKLLQNFPEIQIIKIAVKNINKKRDISNISLFYLIFYFITAPLLAEDTFL